MRAALVTAPGVVEVTDVEDPRPGRRDVVVQVAAAGICGTDLHLLDGELAPRLPVVPGHELAGTVVELGADVDPARDHVAVGDRVAVDPSLYCHECRYCRAGHDNLCERWGSLGVTAPGGAAQYVAAPASSCVRLPDGLRLEDAALVEPLSCGIHAFDVLAARSAGGLGSSVLVYGAGTMGLVLLQLAKRTGAASVEVVDVSTARLGAAERLGCTATATSPDDLAEPRRWDVVVDATGSPTAIQDGLGRVGRGGTYLQVGVTSPGVRVQVDPYRIYRDEITIAGSMAVLRSFERAAALLAAGALDPDVLISHRMPLEQLPTALELVRRGEGLKVQVLP